MSPGRKYIVIVLGMHRGGTSAMARALAVLGVDLGNNLMQPSPSQNQKGFWEDVDVVALNDAMLVAIGHVWYSPGAVSVDALRHPVTQPFRERAATLLRTKLESANVPGIKDPRFARLLPLWRDVFDEVANQVGYVIACRNPLSVARSLAARDKFPPFQSYLLWLEHMIASLVHSQGPFRLVVDYDQLLDGPAVQLRRIADRLGMPFDSGSDAFIEYRENFLEQGLRHSRYNHEDLVRDGAVPDEVVELHRALLDLAADRTDFDDAGLASLLRRLYERKDQGNPA